MSAEQKRQSGVAVHPIPPTFDGRSRVLILGSFPSVRSRASGYFYGHPQNRFWRVLAAVFEDALPQTNEEKKDFLLRHRVALWDVAASCRISGSSDASIKDVLPNDLRVIIDRAPVKRIYVNGKTAEKLYHRYIEPSLAIPAGYLPSTSPANAAWTTEKLISVWKAALEDLL
ncbi:MAG: DNA-deoxyinosine glycosylase [Clostridia bacterium]|nr:DNA-deoxyinosine glycosylase [Clostridia bacterium]